MQGGSQSEKKKAGAAFRNILRSQSPAYAPKLIALMNCGIPKIEIEALKIILDRWIGRPDMAVQVSGELSTAPAEAAIARAMIAKLLTTDEGVRALETISEAAPVKLIEAPRNNQ